MSMFAAATGQDQLVQASHRANALLGEFDELLSLRIALQKPLDTANKLPAHDLKSISKSLSEDGQEDFNEQQAAILQSLEQASSSLLSVLAGDDSSLKKKRKASVDSLWEEVSSVQDTLQVRWQQTLDKWAARLHYGSEKARAQLKVFNQSAWGQIEGALGEERRVMERCRLPAEETSRLGASLEVDLVNSLINPSEENDYDEDRNAVSGMVEGLYVHPKVPDEQDRKKSRRVYDAEVYDDRALYSLLLKTFITSHSSSSSGAVGSMRADDIAALRAYKRKKVNVCDHPFDHLCWLSSNPYCCPGGAQGVQGPQDPLHGAQQAAELHVPGALLLVLRGGDAGGQRQIVCLLVPMRYICAVYDKYRTITIIITIPSICLSRALTTAMCGTGRAPPRAGGSGCARSC